MLSVKRSLDFRDQARLGEASRRVLRGESMCLFNPDAWAPLQPAVGNNLV